MAEYILTVLGFYVRRASRDSWDVLFFLLIPFRWQSLANDCLFYPTSIRNFQSYL